MSDTRKPALHRGVAALAVLWVAILGLGFAAQTTELFGSSGGTVTWLLLAAAALGFMSTGVLGVRLIQRALDQDETSNGGRLARDGAEDVSGPKGRLESDPARPPG